MTEQFLNTPPDVLQMILEAPDDDLPQTEAELISLIENAPDAFALMPERAREELFRQQEQSERTRRQATTDSLHQHFGG